MRTSRSTPPMLFTAIRFYDFIAVSSKGAELVMSKDDDRKRREAVAFQARIEWHAYVEKRNIERIQRMQK